MIHEREQFEVQSTVVGDKTAMAIDPDAMAHIMNVLTDLYSNKILAIIREYSTNAWDAHVEEGVTVPIEITLPTPLSPSLRIKDHGVGLTVEDIHSIYSQYGASTKRGSNAQNGMLGLGCKSALTYCSQFTVTSVKDGTKIVVNVGRDEDGAGYMTVLDTLSTDEGNGTEVQIPIGRSDHAAVVATAQEFYSVWKPGTVLVDDEQPQQYDGLRLSDSMFITERDESQIVMGNVTYPAPGLDSLTPNGSSVLAFADIGEVNFPPNREALMDTKRTRDTVARLREEYAVLISGAIQREVSAAASPADAIKVVVKWSRYIPNSAKATSYVYKGQTLPTVFKVPGYDEAKQAYDPGQAHMTVSNTYSYGNLSSASRAVALNLQEWPTTVWVYNFAPQKYTAQHKRKMLKWCEQQGFEAQTSRGYADSKDEDKVQRFACIHTDDKPASAFIDPKKVVSWDVVKKIQLEPKKTYNGTTRIPGSYDVYTESGYKSGVPGDDIDQSHPLFYFRGNRWAANSYGDALKAYHPHFTLVCLPENRVAKFCRILPAAVEAHQAMVNQYDVWSKKVTADQRTAVAMVDAHQKTRLSRLDAGRLDDPDLREACRVAKIDVSAVIDARTALQRYVDTDSLAAKWTNPLVKYPLFSDGVFASDADHVYNYINAAYAV